MKACCRECAIVVAVGSVGIDIANRAINHTLQEIQSIALDVDRTTLMRSHSQIKLHLNNTTVRQVGASGSCDAGIANVPQADEIRSLFHGADLVILVAELGSTNDSVVPLLPRLADQEALKVAFVVMPRADDVPERIVQAAVELQQMLTTADAVFPLYPDALSDLLPGLADATDTFHTADLICHGINALATGIYPSRAVVYTDLSGMRNVLQKGGIGRIFTAASASVKDAAASLVSLLPVRSRQTSYGWIWHIETPPDTRTTDLGDAVKMIDNNVPESSATAYSATCGDKQSMARVTLVLTKFKQSDTCNP